MLPIQSQEGRPRPMHVGERPSTLDLIHTLLSLCVLYSTTAAAHPRMTTPLGHCPHCIKVCSQNEHHNEAASTRRRLLRELPVLHITKQKTLTRYFVIFFFNFAHAHIVLARQSHKV